MACDSPFYVRRAKWDDIKVPVPCGKCPPCKFRRVNEWVFRLTYEHRRHVDAHFVTLTYDTDHVPISQNGFMTLCKSDFQDYMKRLRKLSGPGLKYYCAGEYGSQNKRPHYHAIVFGVSDTSHFFDAWHLDGVSIGSVHVGQVTSDSIAYTMKYIDKAHFVKKFARDDRVPEFSLMSKGLGSNYSSDDSIIRYHNSDISILYLTKLDGHKVAMPRYYRNKIFSDSQRSAQVDIVRSAVERDEIQARLHHRLTVDYDTFVEMGKIERFRKFYSVHSQNRKL